ncbi:MAG: hypothetical protein V4722_21060 [Bacteroidota bacterium]
MTEHFDDMMRKRLNDHESPVPQTMFDDIRSRMDALDQSFDADINSQVTNYASAVPANMFDAVNSRMEEFDAAFDANVNTRINNYQSAVPDDMWQRIMQEKDRRRPVAWWWAAALLFLLLGAGSIYFYNKQQEKTATPLGNSTKASKTDEKVNGDDAFNEQILVTDGDDKTGPGAKNNQLDNKDNRDLSDHQPEAISGNDVRPKYKNGFFSSITKYNTGKSNNKNDGWSKTGPDNKLLTENGTPIPDDNNPEADWVVAEENRLSLRQLIRTSFNKVSPAQLLQSKKPILPCPMNGDEPRNDWYVDLYASPMMVFKNVTDKVAGKNIRSGMDSTLHSQVSFNAGINLVKNIGEGFLLKTGLQYNQVNELFRNTRVNEIKLITTVTIRTVILAPGDTIYIRDTSVIQQIGTVTKQTQNRYKSWDIPLILGFEFGGKDLRLNANLGIIANIRSSYRGDMLDTSQQMVNIANYNTTGVYKTNIGLGVYAGLGIIKSLGERTDLLIEPHARFNLTNMTTDAAWFKQKNINAGLSVGVRYKLNGRRQR